MVIGFMSDRYSSCHVDCGPFDGPWSLNYLEGWRYLEYFNKFKTLYTEYILLGGGGTLILGGTLIAGFMESAGGCGRLRRPGQLPNSVSCCLMGGRTGEGNRFTLHFSNSYISLRIL